MVRLVFVHGVATRCGPAFDASVEARRTMFRRFAFPGREVRFQDPCWGDFGVQQDTFQTVPDPDRPDPRWLMETALAPAHQLLLTRMKIDPEAALVSLSILASELAERDADPFLADLSEKLAALYIEGEAGEILSLVHRCATDEELLGEVVSLAQSRQPSAQGLAASANTVGKLLSELVIRLARRLSAPVGVFTGDVIHYMTCGPSRRGIRSLVHRSLVEACRQGSGPLVLVGYSLGAVILYELLANETVVRQIEADAQRELRVDLFMTVGCPLGFFREANLVPAAPAGMTGPGGLIRNWLNCYGRYDLLAFKCAPVFPAASDFELRLDADIVSSHTAYFRHPDFFKKLRTRMEIIETVR